jgi:hypothetical protein
MLQNLLAPAIKLHALRLGASIPVLQKGMILRWTVGNAKVWSNITGSVPGGSRLLHIPRSPHATVQSFLQKYELSIQRLSNSCTWVHFHAGNHLLLSGFRFEHPATAWCAHALAACVFETPLTRGRGKLWTTRACCRAHDGYVMGVMRRPLTSMASQHEDRIRAATTCRDKGQDSGWGCAHGQSLICGSQAGGEAVPDAVAICLAGTTWTRMQLAHKQM